jgi:hypothetical protein
LYHAHRAANDDFVVVPWISIEDADMVGHCTMAYYDASKERDKKQRVNAGDLLDTLGQIVARNNNRARLSAAVDD